MNIDHRSRRVSIRRAVAAAALLASASAWAGVQFDLGLGTSLTKSVSREDKHAPIFDADLGYRVDDLAVQAVWIGEMGSHDFNIFGTDTSYGLDRFLGGQVVGYQPIVPTLEAYGGLGVGRSHLSNGVRADPARDNTDGLLSAGLQWHALGLFTMGVGADYLTKTHVTAASVRLQFGF